MRNESATDGQKYAVESTYPKVPDKCCPVAGEEHPPNATQYLFCYLLRNVSVLGY